MSAEGWRSQDAQRTPGHREGCGKGGRAPTLRISSHSSAVAQIFVRPPQTAIFLFLHFFNFYHKFIVLQFRKKEGGGGEDSTTSKCHHVRDKKHPGDNERNETAPPSPLSSSLTSAQAVLYSSFPAWPGEQSRVLSPNGRGGWTPLRPLRGLQETRVATLEESGVLGFPSRRGLTPRGSLECNPEIPAFPGEEN